MIAHLRGRLFSKQPGQAIVEAGGVGYDVTISVPTFTALPAEGGEVSLHIYTQVREDTLALYGFHSRDEKRLFERLITVSGVGPKLAVTIFSGLNPERTVAAIRGLNAEQIKLPVQLRGVVTFFDESLFSRFIQDDTAGIYFQFPANVGPPQLVPGQVVEITGSSSPGEFTWREISAATMKIPDPIIDPITSVVESMRPRP